MTNDSCLSSNGKVLTVSAISTDPDYLGAGQLGSDYITFVSGGSQRLPSRQWPRRGCFRRQRGAGELHGDLVEPPDDP